MVRKAVLNEKRVRVDSLKLAKARLILDARTEAEAVDRALTLVVSEEEIHETLRRICGKGRLRKIFR
jgi:hypothetical protein